MSKSILNWGAFSNATLAGIVAGCQNVYGDNYPAAMQPVDTRTFNTGLDAEAALILRIGVAEATRIVKNALIDLRR